MPLYTNYMTQEEYGTSNLIFTIAQLLSPLLSLTIFDALLRFGLSKSDKRENVLLVAVAIVGTDFFLIVILITFFGWYSAISQWKYYLGAYIFLSIINSTMMNYLKVKGKNRTFASISVFQTFTLAASNVAFIALLHNGVEGYLRSNILALFLSSTACIVLSGAVHDLKRARFDFELCKRMILYSSPMIFNAISWWLISSSDKIMLEILLGEAALGLYSVAAKIPALVNVFVGIFQQAWGISAVSEIETENDNRYYSTVFQVYSTLIFGVTIISLCIIRTFMRFYVGDSFMGATEYVPFLLFSALFSALSTYYGALYTALKKSLSIMATTVLAGIINIAINCFTIRQIGISGAVLGTVVSYFLIAHIRMIDIQRYIRINIDVGRYVFNCVLTLMLSYIVTIEKDCLIIDFVFVLSFFAANKSAIIKLVGKGLQVLLTKRGTTNHAIKNDVE